MKPTADMFVSPYDRDGSIPSEPPVVRLTYRPKPKWVPSRFNARTVGEDGRLILWNTLSGAVSVFAAKETAGVLAHLAPKGVAAPLNQVGEYLNRRGFLVRAGFDEMAQFRLHYAREQWRSDALQLILLASEDCNFRCKYCYEKFKHGTMTPEVRQGVRALVEKEARYLRLLTIAWFGGEPLYGWDAVEELGPFFKEISDRHGIAQSQNMTTNAYLLTQDRAEKLIGWGCRKYQITVDGLAEEHDCKRVGRDGSPTYDVILDNLRGMQALPHDFSVSLRVNFDQENFPRLGQFLEALSEDFAGDQRFQLRFRAVGKWGGDNDESLSTCGVGEQRTVVRELRQKAAELNLHQEGGIRHIAPPGSEVCYAARPFNFIVGATGKLMKCTIALDELEENVVGQLHPNGRLELNDERMAHWVKPHFETDSLCQQCYVLPTCQGAACPLTRVKNGMRTCSGIKRELKSEMRFTFAQATRTRAPADVAAPELAGG
jgi:uncharacterized protein